MKEPLANFAIKLCVRSVLLASVMSLRPSISTPLFGPRSDADAPSDNSARAAAAVSASCRVAAEKSSDPLTNPGDLESLVHRYASVCHGNLSALDAVYVEEARDDEWAVPLEEKIREAGDSAGVVLTGECRRSLCRFDVKPIEPRSESIVPLVLEFDHRLATWVKGTRLEVGMFSVATPEGNREYLFSLVLPSAFARPFLEKMGL